MLTCSTRDVEGVLVITLEDGGSVGDDRQAPFREAIYRAVQSHEGSRFAVDLAKLDMMSSADFGFLISLRRRVEARRGRLVLFHVGAHVLNTLGTMKLLSLFPIAPRPRHGGRPTPRADSDARLSRIATG